MISQILANRISVSYSNFSWTIKSIIGAKFNIKHLELLLSFQFINLIRAEFGKFFDHFIWKRLIWNELVTFFNHSSASWIQAQKLQVKRVTLLRCTKKVIYCLFVYSETCIKGTSNVFPLFTLNETYIKNLCGRGHLKSTWNGHFYCCQPVKDKHL